MRVSSKCMIHIASLPQLWLTITSSKSVINLSSMISSKLEQSYKCIVQYFCLKQQIEDENNLNGRKIKGTF